MRALLEPALVFIADLSPATARRPPIGTNLECIDHRRTDFPFTGVFGTSRLCVRCSPGKPRTHLCSALRSIRVQGTSIRLRIPS